MKKLLLILLISISVNTNAAIVSGDFRSEGDLPYCCGSSGPLVYENLNAPVGAGIELTAANLLSNPSFWQPGLVHIDLDPTTNILTLDSQDTLDFEIFDFWITNISFDASEIITGVSLISDNITNLGLSALLTFTDNSIHINYDIGAGNPVFNFTGNQAQFQISTGTPSVPAPAAAWLLASGLIGLVGVRKKGQKFPTLSA